MSHNINFNDQKNQHSFFSVKEKAWHGLGQILEGYPTSAEAINFAGLDYSVEKRKIFTNMVHGIPDGTKRISTVEVPDYVATVRTDSNQVLGVVGKDYEIVQNKDAFSFFDAIVGGDGIQYETAGALSKGERIFITAKLPGYIKVGRDDLIDKYLFLTTSHDGYGSITAAFTPVRIVCNNTLNAAIKNCSNTVKIRHTANAKDRLEQAHLVMGISNRLSEQLTEIFNQWSRIPVTDAAIKKLIQLALVPNKEVYTDLQKGNGDTLSTHFTNTCDAVYAYTLGDPTQQLETVKGTLFGAYNGITGYFQNIRTYKDSETKLKSLLYGGSAQIKTQKAFELCEMCARQGARAILQN